MARGDLRVIGPAASFGRYLASGGTAVVAGEPIHRIVGYDNDGLANTNEFVLVGADSPIIGTHQFGGVALKDSDNAAAGTTNAQFLTTSCPVPQVGRIRGKAETGTNFDTLSEVQARVGDLVLFDWNNTGAADGGELYTIHDDATADTSGLEIVGGNYALQEIEVTVHSTAYRSTVS